MKLVYNIVMYELCYVCMYLFSVHGIHASDVTSLPIWQHPRALQ